jgi:hypothetical protein
MISVRCNLSQPILALILALALNGGYGVSAEPVSKPASALMVIAPAAESEPILIKINIPSRTLWVYQGERIVRHFPVGVGRVGFPTPTGKFSVIRKVEDPGWENPYLSSGKMRLAPGEDNPLGTRWIGFLQNSGGEYGMHGTDNPASVGKLSSHGCVRLKVPDAEALFDMVEVGTPVEVVYQPVIIRRHADELRVAVYADRFRRGMPTVEAIKADIARQFPLAQVDEQQLKAALSQPLEKYIRVGVIPAEKKVSEPTPPNEPPGSIGKVMVQPLPSLNILSDLSDKNRH